MTTSFAVHRLERNEIEWLERPHTELSRRSGWVHSEMHLPKMAQALRVAVDPDRCMSVINAPRPLATGIDTAVLAMKKAQDRLGVAAYDVSRETAAISESSTKEGQRSKLPAQTPPNPGPPGGAVPGDLAQAMMEQSRKSARPPASDVLRATVDQRVASNDFSANVKTVQAFDAMLEELARIKQPDPKE